MKNNHVKRCSACGKEKPIKGFGDGINYPRTTCFDCFAKHHPEKAMRMAKKKGVKPERQKPERQKVGLAGLRRLKTTRRKKEKT